MRIVNVGFVGCGRHATRDLFPMLSKIDNLKLVSTCDLNIKKAQTNASSFGANTYYSDYKEMISRENLDAIIVVGPPDMHYTVGLYCLESGLHIFVEKPTSLSLNKAKRLSDRSKKNNVFGQVGHFLRHSSAHQLAKKIIKSKEFGKPISINCHYYTNGPWEERWGVKDLDWTYMLVQGVHLIDICRFFMGEVEQLQSMKNLSKNNRLSYVTNLKFENDCLGSLTFSSSAPEWSSFVEIISDNFNKLSIVNGMNLRYQNLNPWTEKFNFNEPGIQQSYSGGISYNSKPEFGYYGELDHFIKCILKNQEPNYFQ